MKNESTNFIRMFALTAILQLKFRLHRHVPYKQEFQLKSYFGIISEGLILAEIVYR